MPHNVDLWRATLTQQRVQRCSTAVNQVWFQRGGGQLCALGMGGVQTLLTWAALWVCCSDKCQLVIWVLGVSLFLCICDFDTFLNVKSHICTLLSGSVIVYAFVAVTIPQAIGLIEQS